MPRSSAQKNQSRMAPPKMPKIRMERFTAMIPLSEIEIDLRPDSPFYDHEPMRRPDADMVEDYKLNGGRAHWSVGQRIVDGKLRNFVIDGRCRRYCQDIRNEYLVSKGEEPELLIEVDVRNDWSDEQVRAAISAFNAHRKGSSERAVIDRVCAHAEAVTRRQKAEAGRTNRKAMLKEIAGPAKLSVAQAERYLNFRSFAPEVQTAILERQLPWEETDALVGVDAGEQVAFLERRLRAPAPAQPEAPTVSGEGEQPKDEQPDAGAPGGGGAGTTAPKPRGRAHWEKLRAQLQSCGDHESAKAGLLFVQWHLDGLDTDALLTGLGLELPAAPTYPELPVATSGERAMVDYRVFEVLSTQTEPVSLADVQRELGAGTVDQIGNAMKRLIKAKVVTTTGLTRAMRYSAVSGAKVDKPVEKTESAPADGALPDTRNPDGRKAFDQLVLTALKGLELQRGKLDEVVAAVPGSNDSQVRYALNRLIEQRQVRRIGQGATARYRIFDSEDPADEAGALDVTESKVARPAAETERDTRTRDMWAEQEGEAAAGESC